MPAIEVEASEIARMMRMRTVANMIPAMVEDKYGPTGAVSFLFRMANGVKLLSDSESLTGVRSIRLFVSVDRIIRVPLNRASHYM